MASKTVRAEVIARDGTVCRCCEVRVYTMEEWGRAQRAGRRVDLPILHLDHIVPRHHGGLTTAENLQVLCDTCNAIKGSRMPNRMIRESCRTSDTLDQLSDGAERMFWRLTTVADDYGRFEADPRVLLSACFPLRVGRLKIRQVEKWLKELILTEIVDTYCVSGKRLGVFRTWNKHQRVRAQHSKYPAPTSDNICPRLTADVPVVEVTEVLPRVEETESRVSEPAASGGHRPPSADDSAWPSPEALVALYNGTAPDECPEVTRLSPARRKKAAGYLNAFPDRAFWQETFAQIRSSRFLRGLTPPRNGHEKFTADFDWLLSKGKDGSENCVKVYEGKYHD